MTTEEIAGLTPVAWRYRERYPQDPDIDAKVLERGFWNLLQKKPAWAKDASFDIEPLYTLASLTPAESAGSPSTSGVGVTWQPIETAPKDGSEFQAWCEPGVWEPRCRVNPDSEAIEIWGRVDYDQDGWEVYPHLRVTHWQPQPAAPTQDGGNGEARLFPKTLGRIQEAIDGYVDALLAREHGGRAQERAFAAICEALGRTPIQEMDAGRRALTQKGE